MAVQNMAIAFPGQGMQRPGMAKAIEASPAWRLFEEASDILDFDLGQLCLHGPQDNLDNTAQAQVAIFVTCLALWELNKERFKPQVFLGHSLGEITALAAAGYLMFQDGVRLVRARGEIMARDVSGGMLAILGLDANTVRRLCSQVQAKSYIQIANENSPLQIVVSGEPLGLELMTELAKEHGARRVVPLNVSGPFHSQLMEGAALEFSQVVDQLEVKASNTPVLSNDGSTLLREPRQIKAELVAQLTNPVRFTKSVQKLVELGIEKFVEISPVGVLVPLARRIEESLDFTLVTDGGL